MARLLQLAPPCYVAAVVQPLLDVERGLPAVLGEIGNRHARDAEGRPGDVALVGGLPVELELREPVGGDHRQAQVGGGAQQRALVGPGIALERRLLELVDAEGVLGGGRWPDEGQ